MSEDLIRNPWIYSERRRWVADDSPDGGYFVAVSWKEIAQEQAKEIERLQQFQTMISDLDRNEHGRHEGDIDAFDHTGISRGNPNLRTGAIIGYDISGRPYVMPPREVRHDPEAWKSSG
jgi:hypothetical protein